MEVAFSGTDRLAPSSAATEVVVGLPQLLLDPLEPVARGSAVTLRGTALLGNRPAPDLELTVGGDAVRTDAAGAFAYTHHVPGDAPLGSSELTVAAESLDASAVASFVVKSAVQMTVTPLDTVRPGELAVMEVRLLNDRGRSLRRAVMRLDDGTALIADDFGVTLLEVAVPDDEDVLTLPLTFTFDGDEQHMPLTYFIGVPVVAVRVQLAPVGRRARRRRRPCRRGLCGQPDAPRARARVPGAPPRGGCGRGSAGPRRGGR